jgi:hypothetical protein
MSNLEKHALIEFRAAGWVDENGKYIDEMQQLICEQVVQLLSMFSEHGHSGTSAPYTINLFKQLAMFEPLVPLTGEDWEWVDISEYGGRGNGPLYQNKRCGHVFKDDDGAYDSEGIIFYDYYINEEGQKVKSHFTCRESRVPITFPYSPSKEYRERGE